MMKIECSEDDMRLFNPRMCPTIVEDLDGENDTPVPEDNGKGRQVFGTLNFENISSVQSNFISGFDELNQDLQDVSL